MRPRYPSLPIDLFVQFAGKGLQDELPISFGALLDRPQRRKVAFDREARLFVKLSLGGV